MIGSASTHTDRPTGADYALLAASLAVMASLPWLVPFWPGQDNPNHVAIAHILSRLGDAGNPFETFFVGDLRPKPYSLYYYLLLSIGQLTDLDSADRVLASGLIVLTPLSVFLVGRRVAPERWRSVLLVVPLAAGWFLFKGFHGFLYASCLGMAGFGFAISGIPEGGGLRWPYLLGTSVTLVLAALAHPIAPVLVAFALGLYVLPRLRDFRVIAALLVAIGPAATLLSYGFVFPYFEQVATSALPASAFYAGVPRALWNLIDSHSITLSYWELLPRGTLVVAVLFLATRQSIKAGVRAHGADASLSRLLLGFAILYFVLPTHGWGAGHIAARAGFFVVVWACLLAELPAWLATRRRIGWSVPVICLVLTIIQWREAVRESEQIEQMISLESHIEQGSTLLPVTFKTRVTAGSINPLVHASAHFTRRRDAVTPFLFATGGSSYRALLYRKPFGPDFLPHFGTGAGADAAGICGRPSNGRTEDRCALLQQLRNDELADIAAKYDYILLLAPPADYLALMRGAAEEVAVAGEWWLFRGAGSGRLETTLEDISTP